MSRIPKLYTSEETGETHSLKEWEYITGVNASTLSYRIKSMGMTLDEAITAEFNQRNNKFTITDPVTGETHSLAEWSDITGIPLNSIYKRYFIYKWPAEKALYGEKHEIINKSQRSKDTYRYKDLTGCKFGDLTVIREADENYIRNINGKECPERKWVCQCDCGKVVEVMQTNLTNGRSTSCGCSHISEMIGKKFGNLTVVKRAPDRVSGGENIIHWYCKCDCGNPNLTIVSGKNLRSGRVTSCGCKVGHPANTWMYNDIIYGDNMQPGQYPSNYLTPAIMYKDSNGHLYTPEEWEAHQAVYFD